MYMHICGIDEVGRGALAGPLIAVAAMFGHEGSTSPNSPFELKNSPIKGIDDSKKLTAAKREELFCCIIRSPYFRDFGIGEISVDEINEVGIEQANKRAFKRAVSDLYQRPDYLLIDGDNGIYGWGDHQHNEPKADGKYWPVGAASILAKVIRDGLMAEYAKDYPKYNFAENAGYGTDYHKQALQSYGPCHIHRSQFIRKIMTHVSHERTS